MIFLQHLLSVGVWMREWTESAKSECVNVITSHFLCSFFPPLFLPFFLLFLNSKDGDDKSRPVIIHRAILGSVERMIAILTENYAGKWCEKYYIYDQIHICTGGLHWDFMCISVIHLSGIAQIAYPSTRCSQNSSAMMASFNFDSFYSIKSVICYFNFLHATIIVSHSVDTGTWRMLQLRTALIVKVVFWQGVIMSSCGWCIFSSSCHTGRCGCPHGRWCLSPLTPHWRTMPKRYTSISLRLSFSQVVPLSFKGYYATFVWFSYETLTMGYRIKWSAQNVHESL